MLQRRDLGYKYDTACSMACDVAWAVCKDRAPHGRSSTLLPSEAPSTYLQTTSAPCSAPQRRRRTCIQPRIARSLRSLSRATSFGSNGFHLSVAWRYSGVHTRHYMYGATWCCWATGACEKVVANVLYPRDAETVCEKLVVLQPLQTATPRGSVHIHIV